MEKNKISRTDTLSQDLHMFDEKYVSLLLSSLKQ